MRKVFCFFLISFSFYAWSKEGIREIFSPFNTSNRCRELLKKRESKVHFVSKLEGLNRRSKQLIEKSSRKKKISTSKKLKRAQVRIERELMAAKLGLKNMEEDIIRKGCPGIKL